MSKIVADNISPRGSDVTIAGVGTFNSTGVNLTGIVTASSGFVGNVTGDATGLSGSPTLSGITSVSTTNLTVNGNVYPATGPLSNRNLIINGAMQVAQRSTSVSVSDGSNEGYQSLDRYKFLFGASADGAATISQSTTVPSGQGFSNSYKVDVTSTNTPSGTENIFIEYRVEAQDLANSGWNYTSTSSYITFSFWARSSKAGTYCLYLDLDDTTTNEYYIAEYTLVADTWKRVEITVPGHADAVINNDNGVGLKINWILASNETGGTAGSWSDTADRATTNQVNVFDSTDGEFYFTGFQLEVGEVATPFEHRSYGYELQRCIRYFRKHQSVIGSAGGYTDLIMTTVTFDPPMRTGPSIDVTGAIQITAPGVANYNQSSAGVTQSNYTTAHGIFFYLGNYSGLTNHRIYIWNDSTDTLTFDAEL